MTEMFGEAWPSMSVPDLAPDDDDDIINVPYLLQKRILDTEAVAGKGILAKRF